MTEQDQKTHDALKRFDQLYAEGHTKACGVRQVWGEWMCTCGKGDDVTRGAKEIRRVAELALFKVNLPENVAKASWKDMSKVRLFWLLIVEVGELARALWILHRVRRKLGWLTADNVEELEAAKRNVQHEAGDVVAFCAFLVDATAGSDRV